jgi:hypothetical protein
MRPSAVARPSLVSTDRRHPEQWTLLTLSRTVATYVVKEKRLFSFLSFFSVREKVKA